MSKIQFIFNNLIVVAAAFVVFAFVAYAQGVWTAPTATPPGDNTAAPVNVGASNQVKIGGLAVGPLAVFGNAQISDNLNVDGVYKRNGVSGITANCPAGQTLVNPIVSGGIVTQASCGAAGGGGGGGPTTIVTTATYYGNGTAVCPAGKTVTGGGCYGSHLNCRLIQSYPSAANQWSCFWYSCGGVTSYVYALCQ